MKKYIKKILFGLFILAILFIALLVVIKYNEEGEKSLPFKLSKIVIMSTISGDSKSETDTIWDIDVKQINDLYLSFEADKRDEKELIEKIIFRNFTIEQAKKIGDVKVLSPTGDFGIGLFSNSNENHIDDEIVFDGAETNDLKKLQIGNSGGTTAFRIEIGNIGNFKSNDETEIKYDGSILQKIGLTNEDVVANVGFDVVITTSKGSIYKGNINFQTPVGNLVEKASCEKVIEDFSNVVFKRVKD